jgi:SpoVK/Ycf46/Vps4 family AAA+-type ATPase
MARKLRRRSKSNPNILDFDKTQYAPIELQDKFSLWILRVIFKLNTFNTFIDKRNYFNKDNVACFLNLEKYVAMDEDDFTRDEILLNLKKQYTKLESRKRFTSDKLLKKNINQLSNLMNLNTYEEQILEFVTLLKQYEILEDSICLLGNELNTGQVLKAFSKILDIPLQEVQKVFTSSSKFSKSSILSIEKRSNHSLLLKLDFISDHFFDNLLNEDTNISNMLKDNLYESSKATLVLDDYSHIQKEIDILVPYLKDAMTNKRCGVNILLYGLPGTGKTELCKTLAKELNTQLFEVSCLDEDDEAIDGKARLKAYKTAQAILHTNNTLLMYDEAEDIFQSSGGGFFQAPSRQRDKAWINKVLESNTIPTIWITNNIYSIDNALVRRFDISIELPIPKKSKRIEIVKKYSNNLLDNKTIELIASNEDIAPALISRAAKVVSSINAKNSSRIFTNILNNTLKAQGYDEIKTKLSSNDLPNTYSPKFINTTINLDELTVGIKENPNARVCLYGAAGTGKSAYGKYLAQELNKKVILKKVSDLQSKYVGECEKNIAAAFEEAKEEKAVLIFDEVDSFLQDRTKASASWQISQVNEMLVQMENFDGIFIATTNLMDNLDSASLRRFDLKLEFNFLKPTQALDIFHSYATQLKLAKPTKAYKNIVQNLSLLTPGDFAAVMRQSRFRPIKNIKDFISRLEDEISVKKVDNYNKMGFAV